MKARAPGDDVRPLETAEANGSSARLKDVERELIRRAYEAADGNVSRAAELLGIPRTTLRARLKRLGMT
ncbi:MAG: helix-turn-helix domain-containing protein [Polyangiaceae bacterium]